MKNNLKIRALNALLVCATVLTTQTSYAAVHHAEDMETMKVGTLQTSDHPAWEGMLAGNANGQPITDWKIASGGGHNWVAADGGTISGGDRYMDIFNFNNVTGRAFWRFAGGNAANALPTNINAPTSVWLRYTLTIKSFDNPVDSAADAGGPFIITRLNSSWSYKTVFKPKDKSYINGSTTNRFFYELEKDVSTPAGELRHVLLEDKLGQPKLNTVYLLVTRYDFDATGLLVGAAAWVNPSYADLGSPDLASTFPASNQYDTFVNPLMSVDMTTYNGNLTYDNLMLASSWDDVVPNPASSDGAVKLVNISTRGEVGIGDKVLIGGFVVSGSGPQKVLVRAVGPTLGDFGVSGTLADPVVTVKKSDGTEVGTNDNWGANANSADIVTVSQTVGAFPLVAASTDAALLMTLDPGGYTVTVSGAGQTTGVALIEVYSYE